jgi:hypothetical protein
MTATLRLAALALLGGAALPLLTPAPATAVVVTVGGVPYDVNIASLAYTLDATPFQLPPLGQMPWWGDDMVASDFAEEVFNQLGPGWDADYGPVFAYAIDGPNDQVLGLASSLTDLNDQIDVTPATTAMVTYAIATTPVPLPLPLFGTAAGLGWARHLRRRLRVANRLSLPTTSTASL